MRDRRAAAWRLLTPVERDALIVLSAMCKVRSGVRAWGADGQARALNRAAAAAGQQAAHRVCGGPHAPACPCQRLHRWRRARRGWARWRHTCIR